jgi:hypothetical protein
MVSTEMLNCKLLSTQAADIKHVYFTRCDRNHQMASHVRTLARTLCSGEEPNAIARWLNLCYRSVKNYTSGQSNSTIPRSSPSSQISVCAPAKRARACRQPDFLFLSLSYFSLFLPPTQHSSPRFRQLDTQSQRNSDSINEENSSLSE